MSSKVEKIKLANGIRVICEPISYVQSVAIGIWCQTGSRMESETEAGISHLIEHMLFKGTTHRTAEQIAQEIEGRGGHLNAFTDREVTCYYARVLAEDVERAIDVLSDMYLHSVFDPDDLELEKQVVQEEIKKYEDTPEDHIHDLHTRMRWGNHPLGRPIIGTHASVSSFTSEQIRDYMQRRYASGKTLVAVAGKVDPEKVAQFVEQMMPQPSSDCELPLESPPTASAGKNLVPKEVEQVHFCLGGDMVNLYDTNRHAAIVMDAIMGGSMSSRLFQEVREKRGLAYAIGSYNALYREAGAFTVYGGTSPRTFDTVLEVVTEELRKLREEPVPEEELERTKNMLAGNLVLGLEGMSTRMTRIARNELLYGRDIPVEETLAEVRAVTAETIQNLANRFLQPDQLTLTAIGPFDNSGI